MSTDEITKGHLARLRIRGAPATIPGAVGFVGEYSATEVLRQAHRSLVCPIEGEVTVPKLRDVFGRLTEVAQGQKLKILGEPMYVVKADPMVVVPNKREHEACLAVMGEAKEDGDVKLSRLEGGLHIVSVAQRGLADLENLYTWLFGKFLPARKHELMRPYLLHRLIESGAPGAGAGAGTDERPLPAIEVQAPSTLSIKPVRAGSAGGDDVA